MTNYQSPKVHSGLCYLKNTIAWISVSNYECAAHMAALCWYWQLLPLRGTDPDPMLHGSVWYNPKGLRIENVTRFSSVIVLKPVFTLCLTLRSWGTWTPQVLKMSVVLRFVARNQSDAEMFIAARPWQCLDWLVCSVACAPPAFYVHTRSLWFGVEPVELYPVMRISWLGVAVGPALHFPALLSPDTSA